jgi:hypothetical protein
MAGPLEYPEKTQQGLLEYLQDKQAKDWKPKLAQLPVGFSPDDMTHALLIDIRGALRTIKGTLIVLTVVAGIALVVGVFVVQAVFKL